MSFGDGRPYSDVLLCKLLVQADAKVARCSRTTSLTKTGETYISCSAVRIAMNEEVPVAFARRSKTHHEKCRTPALRFLVMSLPADISAGLNVLRFFAKTRKEVGATVTWYTQYVGD